MDNVEDGFDPEILRRIRGQLGDLDDLQRRRVEALQREPDDGSLAAMDRPLPDSRFVTIFAGQASSMAIDHLIAWRLLANGPRIPISAHLTLMRAALEGAVRCRWHVDGSIAPGERVGRGWAARRQDQVDRKKFEDSKEGTPRPPLRAGGRRGVERLADLDDPRVVRLRESAGVRTVGFTDTTALAKQYGCERWFRLSSGLAHGKEWSLVATQMTPSAGRPADSKIRGGIFRASAPVALELTVASVSAVHAAIEDLEAYRAAHVTGS